jgi:anion-transporting  ArsA/GET3 family ATPase
MSVEREGKWHKGDDKILMDKLDAIAVEVLRFLEYKTEFEMTAKELTADLTGRQRLRLYGAGVKNYGFIETAFNIARDNPRFTPREFDVENFNKRLSNFDNMRQLVLVLRQYLQTAENIALLESDALYRMALRVYRTLQEHADSRVQGADTFFNALRKFFRHSKNNSGEPTQKELERDFRKVLHGEASGEVTVVNESPVLKAGKRKVVDRVSKGKRVVKATGEGG